MSRPVIGVTVSTRSGWRIFPLMWLSIRLAGGRAVRWTHRREVDVEAVDGVVIGGGDDISADLYGGQLVAKASVDPKRDALEHRIVGEALDRGRPVLGICRGAQMINIALGGTLHQDAYAVFEASRKMWTVLPKKTVCIEEDTRFAMIVGTKPMRVNSLHSQAVDRLGRDLEVVARDQAGMVQAIERVCDPFAVGVQWHPEHLFYAKRQRRLFRALVKAAKAQRERRSQVDAVDELLAAEAL